MTTAHGNPRAKIAKQYAGRVPRKEYEKVLALPGLRPELRAEAFYKLGVVSGELESKKGAALEYWERAMAADPTCRYGVMAQERLKAAATR